MWPKPRPAFTTVLAGFISILLSLLWLAIGGLIVFAFVVGGGRRELRDFFGEAVEVLDAIRVAGAFVGGVIAFTAFLTLLFGWKTLRRRSWARIFQVLFFIMFLLLVLGVLFLAIAGASSLSEDVDVSAVAGSTAVIGGYAAILFFVILLLLIPPTGRDFRRVREWESPAPVAQVPPGTPPAQPPAMQPPGTQPPPPPPTTPQTF
jgi:hypothetical protein